LTERVQNDHAELLKAERTRADEVLVDLDTRTEAALTDLSTKTAKSLENIRRLEDEAGKLVSSAANKAVSGGFLEDAREHGSLATIFQLVGGGLLLLVVLFGFLVVEVWREPIYSLEFLTGRLLVALPFVGLAIYCFREAGRHRDASAEAKSLHLDHQALGPYIELLDKAEKEALRKEMAERAFFRSRNAPPTKQEGDLVHDLIVTLQKAVDAFGKRGG
jgi:Na+/phosphate symporter